MIIVRYSEIALKGKNRIFFERMLIDNIQRKIRTKSIKRPRGRILVELLPDVDISGFDKIFGIASYSVAEEINLDIEVIKENALKLAKGVDSSKTFKVDTKRLDKSYPLKSPEISSIVGEVIHEELGLKVDLKNPEVVIGVEIINGSAYIYRDTIQGLGGLPVGVSGKVLSLLSGGIDSPVSSLLMMKRGCVVDFIHFHNYPYVKKQSIDKVKELYDIVSKYEYKSRLFLIPFTDVQKQIVSKCAPKLRVLLYRRMMLKISERVAKEHNIKALITGENLAQVSSQTLSNMFCVQDCTDLLMLRPLVGMDKFEIINLAKKYGTYEKSIEPHDDCCTFFVPKHPETNAKLDFILEEESKIDVEELINMCLNNLEIVKY